MAAAALTALASCQKEKLENTDNEPAQTVRIISGVFNNDNTKTTLDTDCKTPLWSVGDVIRVLDNTSYQDITLAAGNITDGGKKITFATTLTGTQLYAVYPASATTMTSCTDGNITFTVPAIQDGTFASANICVASGDGSTANTIYFSNATAVVEMTVATGVVYANLTAANKIAGDMTVAMESNGTINSTTTTSLSSNYIFVSDTPSDSKFYMAVAPVDAGTVTVTCNTIAKSGSIDKGTKTLAMDKIYAMDLSGMTISTEDLTGQHGVLNGQEYVIIKAKYNGTNDSYLKWATQNLAVTASGKAKWNSTDYVIGDYFQWAASYDGYGITSDAFKVPTNLIIYDSFTNTNAGGGSNSFTFKSTKSLGFTNDYVPYGGSKYTATDSKTVLDQTDDVANIVLGSTWRIPTGGSAGEIKAMKSATSWTWDETDKGYYVTKSGESLSSDKSNALLFFPAAGYGCGTNLNLAGSDGYYWSSTLRSEDTGSACYLLFRSSDVFPETFSYRYLGFSVRPVLD